jgi:iron complex transport system ATP-binding protein
MHQPSPEVVLQLNHLSCRFNRKKVLEDISFSVCKGEFVAVIGPNGSGKSTLLGHIIGMYPSPDDTIRLYNKSLNRYRQKEIAARIALVPQSEPANLDYSVLQFMLMGLYSKRNPLIRYSDAEIEYVFFVLDRIGMRNFADRKIGDISGGERQKIFIGAALVQDTDILLLDEPTSFLDPYHQREIHDLLSHLNTTANLTIITVTHDINFAAHHTERIMALKNGILFFDEPVERFMISWKMEQVFETPFEFIRHDTTGKVYAFPVEESQKTLFNHLRFLHRIFNTIPNPVFYQDPQGHIRGANQSFRAFFDIPDNDTSDESLSAHLSPDILAALNAMEGNGFFQQQNISYEREICRDNGFIHHLLIQKTVYYDQEGRVEGILGVVEDISSHKSHVRHLRQMAFNDTLTGLPNRAGFFTHLKKAIQTAETNHLYLAVLFIDLDGFKSVNDTYGHDMGDQILIRSAERIRTCIREKDFSARFGGDEFVVCLTDLNDLHVPATIAKRIIDELAKPVTAFGNQCVIGASIGVGIYPHDAQDTQMLIKKADLAMYHVKKTGKNNYIFFNSI